MKRGNFCPGRYLWSFVVCSLAYKGFGIELQRYYRFTYRKDMNIFNLDKWGRGDCDFQKRGGKKEQFVLELGTFGNN